MPEYLTPGVYIEEFEIGAKPIEGVSTSTAGFLGVAEMGPSEGLPELITSFSDFQRIFVFRDFPSAGRLVCERH